MSEAGVLFCSVVIFAAGLAVVLFVAMFLCELTDELNDRGFFDGVSERFYNRVEACADRLERLFVRKR